MADPIVDLPVLSGYAPWFWAMMWGGKPYENRGKGFARRYRGNLVVGDIWLHASLWPGPGALREGTRKADDFYECYQEMLDIFGTVRAAEEFAADRTVKTVYVPVPRLARLDALRGHIIGRIEVVRYVEPNERVDSDWRFDGSLALEVRNPRPLATPVPAKGSISWWTPNEATQAALRQQLEAA